MKRRLFTILSAISLLLSVATCGLSAGSYYKRQFLWSRETIVWSPAATYPPSYCVWADHGNLAFTRTVSLFFNQVGDNRPEPRQYFGFAFTNRDRDGSMPVEGFPNWFVPRVYIQIPLWAVFLVAVTSPIFWLRQRRRAHHRHLRASCAVCGYDLRATPDRCPECGTATNALNVGMSK